MAKYLFQYNITEFPVESEIDNTPVDGLCFLIQTSVNGIKLFSHVLSKAYKYLVLKYEQITEEEWKRCWKLK